MNNARTDVRGYGFGGLLSLGCGVSVVALLLLGGVAAANYEVHELTVPPDGRPGFTLLPPEQTGVWFTNTLSPQHAAENQIRLNGSGVALADVDGDGWTDVFLAALERSPALYRNLGGWRFTNVTAAAGLDRLGPWATGAAFADLDGDGDPDLLLNGIATGTRWFRNDGRGRFTVVPDAGLNRTSGATSLALADIDADGDLDLYVANYRTNTVRSTGFELLNVGGRQMVPAAERGHLIITPEGRVLEQAEPDQLYLNDGRGHFRPVSWTEGAFLDTRGRPLPGPPPDWGLSCAFRDLNGDGAPDLYVANDFHSPDRAWLNLGSGRFRAFPWTALRHFATFSMAVDFADVDRDGHDDFLVSDMMSRDLGRRLMQIAGLDPYTIRIGRYTDQAQQDRTVLFWNRGDTTYAEVACFAGLENSEWNWSVVFLDVDLDGFEDLLATTGHLFDTQDLDAQARVRAAGPFTRETMPKKLLMLPPLEQANLAFHNRGDLTFAEIGPAWGFDQVGVSQAMALADLDNDGDLDVVVNNLNAAAGLYRNHTAAPRLAVRLKGRPPNTRGIGARVTVTGGPVAQSQEMMAGGRYLAGDDPVRVFAAGSASARLRIEVRWPDGAQSVVETARPNCLYEITQPPRDRKGADWRRERRPPVRPWFEDATRRLNHRHHEAPFDDFARQPLLPRRLSQLGPGVAWFDLDGDGREDLIISSGKGGRMAVFRNDGRGGFQPWEDPAWSQPVPRDQTTVLGWRGPDGRAAVLAGSANYEDGLASGGAVRLHVPGVTPVADVIPASAVSVGPLALADYDGDGALDLFVGGRTVPGRHPEPADSQLWRRRAGFWVLDEANSRTLAKVGLVSGAVWSDLNGDGWPDLVLALEWGPVRIFRNQHGRLQEWVPPLRWPAALRSTAQPGTLRQLTGWWNGVNAGDFDGDGNLDLLVSNQGLNSIRRARPNAPYLVYAGDFDESGAIHLLEAAYDSTTGAARPLRDLDSLAAVLPFLRGRFPTHAAFGQATVADVLGPALAEAQRLEVATFASLLLLNRTNAFLAVPLPREAQFATALAVCIGDADGDGNEDVFLSQNFFATDDRTPRCDAGLGLWLRGDGRGGFQPLSSQESGIRVYGEQRGAAVADYDADGRLDLVVTQNGATTRLFHNVGARPGLRIRLLGPPGNPTGVGAVLRLGSGERFGPAREIHAGSGWWSQDAAVQVMATPQPPNRLWVRWPGGRITESAIPLGAREVTVDQEGRLRASVEAPQPH